MNFEEAETKFRELQVRVQRGESISRAEYEDQVSRLAVQDGHGVLWEINPRTGKWMYFDGSEWVLGAPPGRDGSSVTVAVRTAPSPAPTMRASPPTHPPTSQPSAPSPARAAAPSPAPPRSVAPPSAAASARPAPASPESVKPYVRPKQEKPVAAAPLSKPPGGEQPARAALSIFQGREWVPLAIGAVVLLICAMLLFFGGNFVLNVASPPKPTATRTLVPTLPATPVPTVVRLPTQPPRTPTPAPVLAKIGEATANVRSEPNTRSTIITKLKKDTRITLIGMGPAEGNNVWYQVNIAGKTEPGWIRSDTLQIVSGDPKVLPKAP